MRTTTFILLLALVLPTFSGCKQSDHPALGKVSGTVSYRGKPVEAGTLLFEVRGARTAYGKIAGGKIVEVTTYKTGDGVPLGAARIAVFVPAPEDTPPAETFQRDLFKSLVPLKYGDPAASGLTHEIVAGDNVVAIDMQ